MQRIGYEAWLVGIEVSRSALEINMEIPHIKNNNEKKEGRKEGS